MQHIVIVGGGFAGVWAAAAAALARGDAPLRITLITPGDQMVLRPRLYERDLDVAAVELRRILGPIGVDHLKAWVTEIDPARRVVVADGRDLAYDALVLAAGSRLVRPGGLPGAERLFDIDSLDGARALAAHLEACATPSIVVVGAGFVGLEAATALADRGQVTLVDRADTAGAPLGPGPAAEIDGALTALGIDRRLSTSLASVHDDHVVLTDGSRIAADAVVWCGGLRANPLAAQVSESLDQLGRVRVDDEARALPHVFVAGDMAAAPFDADHTTLQACQHASPVGKVAGFNAAAELLGIPLKHLSIGPYVTCLDLGRAGGIFTRGWDRRVMASGPEGAEVKRRINEAIRPPVDDAEAILAGAARVHIELPFFPREVVG